MQIRQIHGITNAAENCSGGTGGNGKMSHAATKERNSKIDDGRSADLRESQTMTRLLDALEEGTDIGHYGQFTFAATARHFMDEEEIVSLLAKQPDMDEAKARATVLHIEERDYNPPRRERILEQQAHQDFQIIPNPDDPDSGNLYRELRFPDGLYENISEYYEEKTRE